jgi:hypothetical protein
MTRSHDTHASRFTSLQTGWVAIQFVVYAAIVATAQINGYLDILFREPIGQKMLAGAAICLVLNFGILIGGFVLFNRLVAPSYPSASKFAGAALSLVCFVFLYMPAVFVILNGPAAVSIMLSLTN